MTAEIVEDLQSSDAVTAQTSSTHQHNLLPAEIVAIFASLACNEKIIFKSQQIDDPELHRNEKQQIAEEVYHANHENFIQRFGSFLNQTQLCHLERCFAEDENFDNLQFILHGFKQKLHTRSIIVKNRRYTAMQDLIKKGEYFSEHEMMEREPALYQELVGQYMSAAEKKHRDSYNVKNTTFSGILMHSLEKQKRDELLAKVNEQQDDTHNPLKAIEQEESDLSNEQHQQQKCQALDVEVPIECQQQWGGFDDEQVACTTSRETAHSTNNKSAINAYITAGERALLRMEFVGIMQDKFLMGEDKDFDYAAIDDNTQLDDLNQLNQDQEDAYFKESDDETELKDEDDENENEESDDELDIYMQHLNKHPSLQN